MNNNYSINSSQGVRNSVQAIVNASNFELPSRAYLVIKESENETFRLPTKNGKVGFETEKRYEISTITSYRQTKSPMQLASLFIAQLFQQDILRFAKTAFTLGDINPKEQQELKGKLTSAFNKMKAHYSEKHSGFLHYLKSFFSKYKTAHQETLATLNETEKVLKAKS